MAKAGLRRLGALAAAAALAAVAALPVAAWAEGAAYSATAMPSYANPVTGAVEDSAGSGNAALGESMVASATETTALLEQNPAGGWYVTLRFKLQDQISSMAFEVSEDGRAFSAVQAQKTQENADEHTADYRFALGNELNYVRCTMDVVPMGRPVVFFVALANFHEGVPAGFVTQGSNAAAAASSASSSAVPSASSAADGTAPASASDSAASTEDAPGSDPAAEGAAAPAETAATPEAAADTGAAAGEGALAETGAAATAWVQEFNADGVNVTAGAAPETPDGGTVALVVALLAAAGLVVGGTVYVTVVRPRRALARLAAEAAAPQKE